MQVPSVTYSSEVPKAYHTTDQPCTVTKGLNKFFFKSFKILVNWYNISKVRERGWIRGLLMGYSGFVPRSLAATLARAFIPKVVSSSFYLLPMARNSLGVAGRWNVWPYLSHPCFCNSCSLAYTKWVHGLSTAPRGQLSPSPKPLLQQPIRCH